MNLNKAFIIGNLTRDPELRTLPSGQPVASFGVATNRFWTKNGEKQEQTEFHNIVAFGKMADLVSQYMKRGNQILVEGRLQTRSWEGKDGAKRNKTEIVAERIQLGPRGAGKPVESPSDIQAGPPQSKGLGGEELDTIEYPAEDINPDEIPF